MLCLLEYSDGEGIGFVVELIADRLKEEASIYKRYSYSQEGTEQFLQGMASVISLLAGLTGFWNNAACRRR